MTRIQSYILTNNRLIEVWRLVTRQCKRRNEAGTVARAGVASFIPNTRKANWTVRCRLQIARLMSGDEVRSQQITTSVSIKRRTATVIPRCDSRASHFRWSILCAAVASLVHLPPAWVCCHRKHANADAHRCVGIILRLIVSCDRAASIRLWAHMVHMILCQLEPMTTSWWTDVQTLLHSLPEKVKLCRNNVLMTPRECWK